MSQVKWVHNVCARLIVGVACAVHVTCGRECVRQSLRRDRFAPTPGAGNTHTLVTHWSCSSFVPVQLASSAGRRVTQLNTQTHTTNHTDLLLLSDSTPANNSDRQTDRDGQRERQTEMDREKDRQFYGYIFVCVITQTQNSTKTKHRNKRVQQISVQCLLFAYLCIFISLLFLMI